VARSPDLGASSVPLVREMRESRKHDFVAQHPGRGCTLYGPVVATSPDVATSCVPFVREMRELENCDVVDQLNASSWLDLAGWLP
jgi:hypothetical protein